VLKPEQGHGLAVESLTGPSPHTFGPRGVGQSVMECVVKPLRVVKVTASKLAGTKNPTMLRVGVAQAGCNPRVILTA
jgi:hypothetical protein